MKNESYPCIRLMSPLRTSIYLTQSQKGPGQIVMQPGDPVKGMSDVLVSHLLLSCGLVRCGIKPGELLRTCAGGIKDANCEEVAGSSWITAAHLLIRSGLLFFFFLPSLGVTGPLSHRSRVMNYWVTASALSPPCFANRRTVCWREVILN